MRARLLLALLFAAPVVELAVFIEVGRQLGALPVILTVAASSLLGMTVLRRAGRRALSDLGDAREQWASGMRTPPLPEAADRALVGLAGVLLLVPGLVGSAIGLLLLLRPVRTGARALARRSARRAVGTASVRVISVEDVGRGGGEPGRSPTSSTTATAPQAIEGTVIESHTEVGGTTNDEPPSEPGRSAEHPGR